MGKRITRRELLRCAGLASAAGILAACAPTVIEKQVVVTPTPAPRKLLVTSGKLIVEDCPNSVADMPAKQEKEKMFREAYPDIDLTINYFLGGSTDDFKQKKVTEMAAGIYADAVYFQGWADWIRRGVCLPLDDWINADSEVDWNDYLPGAQNAVTYRGKRYQLPVGMNAWAFYYNKERLQSSGGKMPEDYVKEDRWTWNDGFLELCQANTKGEGITKTWGINLQTGGGYWGHDDMLNVLWSNDADFWRSNPWRCTLDEPQAIESLQYIYDLIYKYQVNPPPGVDLPGGLELNYAAFMRTGIWMLSSGAFRESFEKFGFEKMGHIRSPYGWKTGYSRNEDGGGGGMITPTKAERPETAWVWHKWNANEYVKVMVSNYHVQAPARKSLLNDPSYLNSFAPFESKEEWDYALNTARKIVQPNNGDEAINLMMAEWDRVKLGEISVEEFVANVKPQVDDLIKDTPED